MRQGAEHELDILEGRILGCHELQLSTVDARYGAALIVRCCEDQLEPGMPPDEPTELSARIPARAKNPNWNLIHRECIIMHEGQVNPDEHRFRGGFESPVLDQRANGEQA